MKPLEAVNWLFPLWQKKNKGRQHIRRKNSRSNASLILRQFFRHIIDNGFNMLSPLDNLTFTPLRFGRLAATSWVMIDNPLTVIADCLPSDSLSRYLPRRRIVKMKTVEALFFATDTLIKVLKHDNPWSKYFALSVIAEENQRETTHTPKK